MEELEYRNRDRGRNGRDRRSRRGHDLRRRAGGRNAEIVGDRGQTRADEAGAAVFGHVYRRGRNDAAECGHGQPGGMAVVQFQQIAVCLRRPERQYLRRAARKCVCNSADVQRSFGDGARVRVESAELDFGKCAANGAGRRRNDADVLFAAGRNCERGGLGGKR